MPQQTTFTPSGTETISLTPGAYAPVSLAMPSVDAANPDTMVFNGTSVNVSLSFGTSAASVGAGVVSAIRILPGQAVLLTAKASVLAAAAANPAVIGGAQGSAAGSATVVSAILLQHPAGGQVTITRGVASANYVF